MRSSRGICASTWNLHGKLSPSAIDPNRRLFSSQLKRDHTISSLGPDSGNAVVISEDNNCNNPGWAVFYPGDVSYLTFHPTGPPPFCANRTQANFDLQSNLDDIGWNNRIGSFVVRQVAVLNGHECLWSVFPGASCNRCCNGCNRSGGGCCPNGQHC